MHLVNIETKYILYTCEGGGERGRLIDFNQPVCIVIQNDILRQTVQYCSVTLCQINPAEYHSECTIKSDRCIYIA